MTAPRPWFLANFRRMVRHHPERRRACPVCGERTDRVHRAGELPASALGAERAVTGLCSSACRQSYYNIGPLECVCGEPVLVAGADCRRCHHGKVETDAYVFIAGAQAYVVSPTPCVRRPVRPRAQERKRAPPAGGDVR